MAGRNCGAASPELSATQGLASIDFERLLTTNEPPTDPEILVLQDYIANDRPVLNALNAQIDFLRASESLDRRITERDEMAEQIQRCTAVLSPVRRLPPELICEFFAWTLPCTRRVDGQMVDQAPWYLGHISRLWRDIALACPSLWSLITLYHSEGYPHEVVSPVAMIETQLIRSGSAPLAVDFRWTMDENFDATPFLDVLLPHSNRWLSLRLDCHENSHTFLLELLRPAKGQLSQLKKLEFARDLEPVLSSMVLDVFSIAPCLHEVFLTNPGFDYDSPPLLLPWGQLTRYRGVFGVHHHFNIVQAASNLVECGLAFTDSKEIPGGIITLPHLRRFYVEQTDFLAHLAAPELEYLSCYGNLASLLLFILRTSCRLTMLVLENPWSPRNLIPLLKSIPSLKNLVLRKAPELDNGLWTAMTLSGSSNDLCPNLSTLTLGCSYGTDHFRSDLFISMIRSRVQSNCICRLSCLRIFSDFRETNRMDQIQVLREDGVDLTVLGRDEIYDFLDALNSFVLPF
jgi:hypothetical protein